MNAIQYDIDYMNGDNFLRKEFYLENFSGVDVIVELGVARGDTSRIFLQCARQKVIGVDIAGWLLDKSIYDYAESLGVEYEFINKHDLLIDPIDCDILFIDSSHAEEHTYQELKKFSPAVKKFIALHDINPSFETLLGFDRWYAEEGECWEEYYRDYNNCGLLVIQRKN